MNMPSATATTTASTSSSSAGAAAPSAAAGTGDAARLGAGRGAADAASQQPHLSPNLIRILAEQMDLAHLSDDVATALTADVEYRVREITQEAMKFMRHAKRRVLTTEDVNSALRVRNVEPLYGFSNKTPPRYARATGTADLYFVEDREVSFRDLLHAPLPRCPLTPSLHAHWLAIEGVQPAVPQNAPPDALERGAKKRRVDSEHGVEVKPVVQHMLSKELQLYFDKLTEAVAGSDERVRSSMLASLSTDPGLHQLMPYLAQFVRHEVTQNLRNLPYLESLMRMVRALLVNRDIRVETYLHQLMPTVLTCIVGRRLCENAWEDHWKLRAFAASLTAYTCRQFGTAYPTLQPRVSKTLLQAFLDVNRPLTTHFGAVAGLCALGTQVVAVLLLPNLVAYLRILAPALRVTDNPIKAFEARTVFHALLQCVAAYPDQSETAPLPRCEPIDDASDDAALLDTALAAHYSKLRRVFGALLHEYLSLPPVTTLVPAGVTVAPPVSLDPSSLASRVRHPDEDDGETG